MDKCSQGHPAIKPPLAYDRQHALNAICPYFTMFPLEYPMRVLARHRFDAEGVMDPFCGRGTTLYAARVLGIPAYGIDSSPIAVAIAQAKLCKVNAGAALKLAQEFIAENKKGAVPDSEFFQRAFSARTLRAICAIRTGLKSAHAGSHAAVLLRAAMLGCLHGPKSKHPDNQGYLSNQMPRTFASKPDYSVRYWKRHRLKAYDVDVIAVLRRKLQHLSAPISKSSIAQVRLGDSRARSSVSRGQEFSVVVTSPPYYGMRTYVEDQWLRNWFLGGPPGVKYGVSEQVSHTSPRAFAQSLGAVWANMARSQADTLDMYVRFGVIPSRHIDPKTLFRESLECSGVKWKSVSTRAAQTAHTGRRQAQQMTPCSTAGVEYDFHVIRQ